MEDISGKDLAWFFGQWLYRAGSPALEGGWRYNAAAKKIEIELAEVQLGAVYRLPLEVAVRGAGGVAASIARIEMTAARQSFEIPAESEPAAVELDPNTWVLMDAHFTKR